MNWVTKNYKANKPNDYHEMIFCLFPKRCVDGRTRWLEKVYKETHFWWGVYTQTWRVDYFYYPLTAKDDLRRAHMTYHEAVQQIKGCR